MNKQIPPTLDEVFAKCLEKDPNLRYQSAAEVRSDLKRIKRDSDSQKLVAAVEDMSRVRRLGRFPLAMAIVSTLVILVAISMVSYRHLSTRHLLKTGLVHVTQRGSSFNARTVPASINPVVSCESIHNLNLPNTTITTTESITGGSFTSAGVDPIPNLPSFCRVKE